MRAVAVALPVLAIAALSSCGGDDNASTTTVVQIQPQSYNTQPQVLPTTTGVSGATGEPGQVAGQEQIYTVKGTTRSMGSLTATASTPTTS